MKKTLLFCFLAVLLAPKLYSQCTQTLRLARTVYDEGRIHELEGLMKSCLEGSGSNGFSSEEKVEAYRLLTLGHIFLDEPEKADAAMLNLLRANPEFKPDPDLDPAEFITLYETFRTKPIYQWGPKVGGTLSTALVEKLYGVNDSFTASNTSYDPDLSFETGLMIEKLFNNRLGAMGEVLYSSNKYIVENAFVDSNETLYARTNSTETKSWISLNVAGTFKILPKSAFDPTILLGPSVRYLLTDQAKIETEFPEGGEQATGTDESLKDFRNPISLGLMLGVSARRKIGRNYIYLEAKYTHGLNNITKTNFDNGTLSTFYGYALDNVKMTHFTLSLGFLIPKYSPKKLTK